MDFTADEAVAEAPAYLAEFDALQPDLDKIDRWWRWDHDKPHAPRTSTSEYRQLADRAQTPWLGLVVTSLAQILIVEGYRPSLAEETDDDTDDDTVGPWRYWQMNGMDARQVPIHVAALAYGYSFVRVAAGQDATGQRVPVMRGLSPRRMLGFYDQPGIDEWPAAAIQIDRRKLTNPATKQSAMGREVRLWGSEAYHILHEYDDGEDGKLRHVAEVPHGAKVCPIVRYENNPDLEGRTPGEVEPFIPVAARIDQTTFDRLVVQRFSSWVVRTIAGMAEPADDVEAERKKLQLRVEDLLVATDAETKFGSLPATPLKGFLEAKEADVHDLAAVTQTPPHSLLGKMVNLSAEALAAAETSHTRKGGQRRLTFGDAHGRSIRLAAAIDGNTPAARDVGGQVLWRDIEARSLAQVADALGKMATMLGVPPQALWSRIPGTTSQDVEEWKQMLEESGGVESMVADLLNNTRSPELDPPAG